MLTVLRRTDRPSVFLGSTLRLRAEFVDNVTNADQAPTAVTLTVHPPPTGTPATTSTQGGPIFLPVSSFTLTTTGASIVYEALLQIPAGAVAGIWGYGWQALDAGGNALVTEWGSFVVELTPQP